MRTRWLAAVAVVVACMVDASAQRGRALMVEDYYHVQTVGNPQISPDGQWVVFSVSSRVEQDNSTRTEVLLAPSNGSTAPRRVVHYGRDISDPSWADDSRLQYTVDRQAWAVNVADPAASPEKHAPLPSGAVRSADGKWLALTRDKPQPRVTPAFASEFEKRHEERFKGKTFDWKDFQRDGQPFPAPNLRARPAAQLVIQAAPDGEATVLVDTDIRPAGIAWHPNGNLLAFVADPDWRDELKYESPDLWTVTTDGQVRRVTNDDYVHGGVGFSPDGQWLSFVRTFGTDMIIQQKLNHGGPRDLYIRPVDGGEPINLTAKWDLDPGTAMWAPDSRHIYFTASIGGEIHLFRVAPTAGASVEQVTRGERRVNGLSIDRDFKTIAYTGGRHDAPPDVFTAGIDGSGERRISDLHARQTRDIAFSKTDRLRWASYDGTQIEGWLTYPHGYDPSKGPYPLIVNSHGGPHSAVGYSFDFKKQFFAANGYFVLDTNFRSSTGYGDAFKWATWGEWGNKDGQDVVSGIDHVIKNYPIDAKRVGHIGHSYGGFMGNWLITQYPDRFAAAVVGAGISNWISDYGTADIYRTKETEFFGPPWEKEARDRMIAQSPLTHAGRVKTPTLFIHGEVDHRVPFEEGEQMYFALRRRGIPARMIQYAGQSHGISGHWNNVHRIINELGWFNQYLGARPSTTTSTGPSGR
ncbi:MAG TPA: S9 family peptidase [Vicinamibacterales bacterium]|nr:S9 family peptidase [Vicinamibacterales bacterium]